MFVLGGSFLNVCFRRQFSGCMFWAAVLWMFLLGDSFLNVSFGRQFSGCDFWETVL